MEIGHPVCVLLGLGWMLAFMPSADAGDSARAADGKAGSFLDSFGINMQMDRDNHDARAVKLIELGIRHNRCTTGVQGVSTVDETVMSRITALAEQQVKSTLLWTRWSSMNQIVATTARLGSAVVAIEGPNETNLASENFIYNGLTFPEGTRLFQRDLYKAIKADARTSALPVYLTTVAPTAKYALLGNMEAFEGIKHMDYGNMHAYYSPGHLLGDKLGTYHIVNARVATPTLPLVATETGFSSDQVPDLAQAKYAQRVFAEGFRQQIARTYWFALADDRNGNFGLLRSDLTAKPSFAAVRDLIAILRDPGGSGTYPLGDLNVNVGTAPASVHRILLRSSNGIWSLLVWNEVLSESNLVDLAVAPVPVTVSFGSMFAAVRTYRPLTNGTAATRTLNAVDRITLDVTDDVQVIRMSPAGRLQWRTSTPIVGEAAGSATMIVDRLGSGDGAISANVSITGGTAPGTNYGALSANVVSWPHGDTTSRSMTLPIVNDAVWTGNRTVIITLSNPTGTGAELATPASTTLTISEDETSAFSNSLRAEISGPMPRDAVRVEVAGVSATMANGVWSASVPATIGLTAVPVRFYASDGSFIERQFSIVRN